MTDVVINTNIELGKLMLLGLLKDNILDIVFTKTDGSERAMKCTLKEDYLVKEEKKTERVKKPNDDVISVWDVEMNAWRSFKFSKLISADISSTNY